MNILRNGVACVFLCLVCLVGSAQTTITLNSPDGGRKEYVASQEIKLEPNYEFTAGSNDFMWGYIDDRIPGQTIYESVYSESDFGTRTIVETHDVGYTTGQEGVSPTGGAAYSIPIKIPSGTKGFVPSISVNYNSQSGNGLLGMGWNLAATSMISRVGKTIYHNGKTEAIKMDNSDGFALDGQRFFPISGANGENNTTYGFENENFSKVTSYGQSGNGPEWFKVETKNGMTMEFGRVFRSTMPETGNTIAVWGLTKMNDPNGNYIEYRYKTDNYQLRLSEIRYTGNSGAGVDPYNKIKFYYNDRTDQVTKYIAVNTKYKSNYLLDKIVVESDGSVYKNYEFKYGKSKFSFLNSVQELASDGSKLNSTIFKYNEQSSTLAETSTTLDIDSKDLIFADFDGDGLDDALVFVQSAVEVDYNLPGFGGKGTHKVYYNTECKLYKNNGGTFQYSSTKSFGNNELCPIDPYGQEASNRPMLGDFNGDGMMDFATSTIEKVGNDYKLKKVNVYISNGTGFLAPITKPIVPEISNLWDYLADLYTISPTFPEPWMNGYHQEYRDKPSSIWGGDYCNPSQVITIGDYNGDGLSDILINIKITGSYLTSGYAEGDLVIWDQLNKDYSFIWYNASSDVLSFQQITENSQSFGIDLNARIMAISFDGDSKSDICIVNGTNTTVVSVDKQYSESDLAALYSGGYPQGSHNFRLGDFNGDSKTDLLLFNGTNWNVAIGSGAGWSETHFMSGSPNPGNESIIVVDINGDGLSDIVHGREEYSTPTLNIHYSLGDTFKKESHVLSDEFSDNNKTLISLDFDGDGRQELAKTRSIFVNTRIIDFTENNDYTLAAIKDGFNKETKFEYSNITDDDIYTKSMYNQNGTKSIQKSLQVVQNVKTDNGIGGENTTSYSYQDLYVNRLGSGFLGFGKTIVFNENLNTRVESTNELSTRTNHIGLLPSINESYLHSSDELVSSSQSVFDVIPRGSHRWETRLLTNIATDHINNWKTINENIDFDAFGNVEKHKTSINYVSSSAMIESVETNTTFVDDNYGLPIPYLPSTITVEKIRNGETPYSRTRTNTYTSKGQLATSVNDVGVTKSYTYDTYGHVISTSTSASGVPTVTESKTFDNKGRYLTSSTNTLGQTSSFSYYRNLDKLKQTIGITGLITKMNYDKWGALTKTTYPDGRTISVTREFDVNSSTYNASSDPSLSFSIYKIIKVPSNGMESTMWYDILGREVQEMSDHPNGSILVKNTAYNEIGKLHKVSEPHFISSTAANITAYSYADDYFRVTEVANALSYSNYTYDNTGSFAKTTVTQSNGQSKSQSTDAAGRTVKSLDHGGELTYEYYSNGLSKSTELAGVELVSMEYDVFGRQTKLTDANAGITEYTYNAYNQLVTQTDANGNITTFTYDDKGDVASEAIAGMSGSTLYEYYTAGGGLNQLKKVTAPNGFSSEYTYDNYGRSTEMKETIGTEVLKTEYEYNSKGENTAIVYPSGHRIEYEYTDGIIDKVKDGSTTLFQNAVIDQFGNYTQYSLANGSMTGTNEYDQYGFLEKIKVGYTFEMNFLFDATTGNLRSRERVFTTSSLLETFSFDNLNRLTGMTIGSNTKTITYQNNGNKTTETDLGPSAYSPVSLNQQMDINPFQSLARTAPLQTVNYTKFDRTKDIEEGDYKLTLDYGPYKNRKKTVLEYQNSVTQTRYYSGSYEKTINTVSGVTTTQEVHYISCGNGVTVAYVIEGTTSAYHYLHTDYLGSILAVSDASGNLEYEQNFDAWGRDRNPVDWSYTASTTPRPSWLYRGFTGHEHLREFTLINMNARMYDTETGRMLAVDNYVLDAHNSQDYNRYSYARNNPLKYSDPSGESVIVAVAVGAIVGAYLGGSSANGTFNPTKWEKNSTTWIAMGTGALIGAGTGALGATGQLSYAIGTSIAGVSIGGIALNNSGSNYNLNLFAGSSSSGYNYNLGSAKNRKYNPDPFASNDAYVDYASLPPADPRGTAGALITEFTDAEYLQMGKTQEQIRRYRETGSWLTVDDVATAMSGVGLIQSGVAGLMDYAKVLTPEAKKLVKYGGKALGIPGAYTSIRDAYNDPSPGSILKAAVNTGTVVFRVNPVVGGVITISDMTGLSDYLYNNLDTQMDRITW